MGVQGRPIVADEDAARAVGEWWARNRSLRPLTLRSEFVRPPLFDQWARRDWMRPAMRDLVQRRGHATRLYLVAMLEQQTLQPPSRKRWTAEPLLPRHDWDDRLTTSNELMVPSWASLLLGFTRKPPRGPRQAQWHRSRYEAVRNAFSRLTAVGLFDPADRVIHAEHREWRWNSRIVDKRYTLPQKTEATFQVPVSLFTSGAYLRLSGGALYSVLMAFEYDQLQHLDSCFQINGFTWQILDSAQDELRAARLPRATSQPLKALSEARVAHQRTYQYQLPVSRDDPRNFPRIAHRPWPRSRAAAAGVE